MPVRLHGTMQFKSKILRTEHTLRCQLRCYRSHVNTGNFYGHSFGRYSQAEAKREALANCNRQAGVADACEIATWFSDGCGALAIGSDGTWGADRAETTAEASAKALKACRSEVDSGACSVVALYGLGRWVGQRIIVRAEASYKDGGVPPLPTAFSSVS